MALEPATIAAPVTRTEYVCPMHPEIVRPEPGSCPICGMALEPRTVTLEDAPNPELVDMTRRFWISAALSLPLFILAMSDMLPGQPLQHFVSPRLLTWIQFVLATPVVLWGGWPFFERGWRSIVNRSLNMFTLIAIGVGAAYVYSVVATLFPGIFPRIILRPQRHGRCLLRSGGDHHHARAAGPGPRAARAQPNQQRHQSSSRTVAKDRSIDARRWQRRRRSAGSR